MKKLTILEITASAESGCVCCSKGQAEQYFRNLGANGKTCLCNVLINGEKHLFWLNIEKNSDFLMPVFVVDMKIDSLQNAKLMPINESTLIYHRHQNGYGVCYIALFIGNEIVIRQLKIIATQQILESYCSIQGIIPEEVTVEKLFTIQDNRYLSTCWSFSHTNSNELDEYGEPQRYVNFIPVDLADSDFLSEVDLMSVRTECLKENSCFQVQGKTYRVLRDKYDKLFFTDNLFSPYERNSNDSKSSDADEKTKAEKTTCKFIPLNQH